MDCRLCPKDACVLHKDTNRNDYFCPVCDYREPEGPAATTEPNGEPHEKKPEYIGFNVPPGGPGGGVLVDPESKPQPKPDDKKPGPETPPKPVKPPHVDPIGVETKKSRKFRWAAVSLVAVLIIIWLVQSNRTEHDGKPPLTPIATTTTTAPEIGKHGIVAPQPTQRPDEVTEPTWTTTRAAPKASGLRVVVTPPARGNVDGLILPDTGKEMGETLVWSGLGAGTHRLKVYRDGYQVHIQNVTIVEKRFAEVRVELQRE